MQKCDFCIIRYKETWSWFIINLFRKKIGGGVIPKIEDFICDFGDFISKVQTLNKEFELPILLYIDYRITPPPIFYKKGLEKNQDQVPLYLKIHIQVQVYMI